MKKPKPVSYRDVSTIMMVAGNEKKFDCIIHDRMRKRWVGIGWVTEDRATLADYLKYPEVKDEETTTHPRRRKASRKAAR